MRLACVVIDHGADVCRQHPRVADAKLVHGAEQHCQDSLLDLALDVEDAQRRAALAGALEGGRDDVAHRLLGQRGGIDDHRVEPAGLRDERCVGREVRRHRAVNESGSFGRAGEAHTVDARIGRERCSHRCAIARQQLHRSARDAGLVHEPGRAGRDERRLLRWLRDDRIAGGKRTENLAREDREREVPGRDAGDHAPRGRARTGT